MILSDPTTRGWLSHFGAGTRESYEQRITVLADQAGAQTALDLGRVSRAKAAGIRDRLAKRYKPGTAQGILAVGRSLCSYLVEREIIVANPFAAVRPIRVGMNSPAWNKLTPDEEKRFLAAAGAPMEKAVVLGFLRHGFRASELAALRWSHCQITPEGRVLITWRAKGHKERRHLMNDDFLSALGEAFYPDGWATMIGKPYHLVQNSNGPYDRKSLHRLVTRIAKRAGVKVTPHGLRATYITRLCATRGIADAQKLAGHAWITTTQRYDRREVLE